MRGAGKDKIELLLSLGATRWEATREIIQRSVRVAMTPVLNQMNVVGIVSIPGMMTGQILGGTDPSQVPTPMHVSVTWSARGQPRPAHKPANWVASVVPAL